MYNFTFNIPTKIHFGKDTISSLSELKAYGSKVLLVKSEKIMVVKIIADVSWLCALPIMS